MHTQVLDITSKNLWSLGGHLLREKIHEHILIHGNLTKKTKINVGCTVALLRVCVCVCERSMSLGL